MPKKVRDFPTPYEGKYAQIFDGSTWLIEDKEISDFDAPDIPSLRSRIHAAAWQKGLKARMVVNKNGLYVQATPKTKTLEETKTTKK